MSAEVRGKGITETGDIPGIKNVIAVGSGKGGVGKSTMAAAIAYGLRSYGASVGLMDADVYGPSIPHLVGAIGPADGAGRSHSADRDQRPQADVDGISARARKSGDHARADAPRDHAAVPSPGRLGEPRLPGDRLAAGHRRRAADAGPGAAADRSGGGVHAAGSRAARCNPCNHDVSPAQSVRCWA